MQMVLQLKRLRGESMIDIEIKDGIYVQNLSEELCQKVEEDLTFPNPKYQQIMKYSKYGSTREPKFLTYCKTLPRKVLKLPIGYLFQLFSYIKEEDIEITDYRKKRIQKDFPEFKLQLREAQQQAMKAYLDSNSDELNCSGGIILPTGKGKTILGLAIAASLKTKTLIIVHKDDLVKGWQSSIEKCFNYADTGIIKAKKRKVGKHFTIATIQTLNRLSPEELKILYTSFGLIIQDEMHHCPSSSFSLANNFYARYRLGLTATPERNDGLAHIMNLYYGSFCYVYESDPDEEEDILPVKVISKEIDLYFNPICKINSGKYTLEESSIGNKNNFDPEYKPKLGEARIKNITFQQRPKLSYAQADSLLLSQRYTINKVCNDIFREYMNGHSCIVFFKQVENLLAYKEELKYKGIPEKDIGLYYGGNSNCDEVKETAENRRKYITLTTYSKATEGTDVQQWEVCFLVSSINNGKDVEQAVGRVRRKKANGNKLDTAIVYDYAFSNCYPMYSHRSTRFSRYQKLHFQVTENKQPKLFNIGFR